MVIRFYFIFFSLFIASIYEVLIKKLMLQKTPKTEYIKLIKIITLATQMGKI